MQTPTSSFKRLSWRGAPLAAIIGLAILAAIFEQPLGGPSTSMLVVPKPSPTPKVVTNTLTEFDITQAGFQTHFDPGSQAWRWQYAQRMVNGCSKLLFRDDPVKYTEPNQVSIELMTYSTDDACTLPPVTQVVRGGIHLDNTAHFHVIVDGQTVYN